MPIENDTKRASKNEVTGDTIKSKVTADNKFAKGFDRIWGPKDPSVPKPPPVYTAEELERDNPYNQWMYE